MGRQMKDIDFASSARSFGGVFIGSSCGHVHIALAS